MAAQSSGAYYIPHGSAWPILGSVALFFVMGGAASLVNEDHTFGMIKFGVGMALLLVMLFGWFGTVIKESVSGIYNHQVDISFRMGMVWFIFSEVMFFACFFGVLYYVRRITLPELSGYEAAYTPYADFTAAWPSAGPFGEAFTPMGAWGIPAINTLLLLTSGVTLTIAHHALIAGQRTKLIGGLAATIALGVVFMGFQVYEYAHAYSELGLTLGAGVYGATFFITTGFHGLHVTLGAIMLTVILGRCMKGHFSKDDHFAFEAVAWYWHFVDVVWLGLYLIVYWM